MLIIVSTTVTHHNRFYPYSSLHYLMTLIYHRIYVTLDVINKLLTITTDNMKWFSTTPDIRFHHNAIIIRP
jgi:hypothetical protein